MLLCCRARNEFSGKRELFEMIHWDSAQGCCEYVRRGQHNMLRLTLNTSTLNDGES